jgi:hypothetical protein
MKRHIDLFFVCSASACLFITACGDDDEDPDTGAGSTGETASTTAPSTTAPSSTTDASTSSSTTAGSSSTTTTDGTSTTTDSGSSGSTGGDAADPGIGGGAIAPVGTYTGLAGSAVIVRHDDGTDVSLQISGLTANTDYVAHVHAQACADEDGGGHYKIDPTIDETEESNELWLTISADADGNGRVEITTDHLARPDAIAVVVHDTESNGDKMACADLAVPNPADAFTTTSTLNVLAAATNDGFGSMTATATMERNIDGSTTMTLDVTGLGDTLTYPVHVHETDCSVADGTGHYKIDYDVGTTEEANELWLPVTTDGAGDGSSSYTVDDHIARAEAQSIVIHDDDSAERYACIDLE